MNKFNKISLTIFLCVISIFAGIFTACNKEQLTYVDMGEFGYAVKAADTNISGDIVIPSTYKDKAVYALDNNAFKDCNKITSITIPEGVTSIWDRVFQNCSATTIKIPVSVTSLGRDAFTDSKVKSIEYSGTKGQWRTQIKGYMSFPENTVITCSDGVLDD